jgi:signal transduction histidine kinase
MPESQPKPVPLPEVVGAVATMLRPSIAQKNASLDLNLEDLKGARVLGDSNHFEAAFSALLSNAADAIPAGGSIRIHGHIEPAGGSEITIDDNGPGIPAELQASVFEPFFTTKPAGHGTGLGLPIARSIMERHRGTLQLKSLEAGGTRVTVRLPILPAPAALRNAKEAAP